MIRTILVALDASPRAPAVFDAACELARPLGARLVLYQGVTVPPDFSPADPSREPDPLPALLERTARAQLEELRDRAPDLACELRIDTTAQPWRAILDAADAADADLIALGSHGFRGWDHLLGTTAGRVANVSQRSVLVVHERPPAAPRAARGS